MPLLCLKHQSNAVDSKGSSQLIFFSDFIVNALKVLPLFALCSSKYFLAESKCFISSYLSSNFLKIRNVWGTWVAVG